MAEMIQQGELVDFVCPHCGYIAKGNIGEKMRCPACNPDFHGWTAKTPDDWVAKGEA